MQRLATPPVRTPPTQAFDDAAPMIIDGALPTFDVVLAEHVVVDATREATWVAVRDLDLLQVSTPLLLAAFWVRRLPDRLRRTEAASPPTLVVGANRPALPGWVSLGQDQDREIAFGAVGRFWKPAIEWNDVAPEDFASFDEPGWGRIAANFSLRAYGEQRTLLSYECRTGTNDPDSRRHFARYWWLIRPFVGHVMRATLALAKLHAEQQGVERP
jgi:hypothetical protein